MRQPVVMEPEVKRDFREHLKIARENAFRDAEAFDGIIHVIERLGCLLCREVSGLGSYKSYIEEVVKPSALTKDIPQSWRMVHTPFSKLYTIVREGRNDALHQGAFARHLTAHAVELALVMEDALRVDEPQAVVSDFMVRNLIYAELWQPVSYIRQQMLVNSFSFLPVNNEGKWFLISDLDVVKYLMGAGANERNKRLAKPLRATEIVQRPAILVNSDMPISEVVEMH